MCQKHIKSYRIPGGITQWLFAFPFSIIESYVLIAKVTQAQAIRQTAWVLDGVIAATQDVFTLGPAYLASVC